MKKPLTCGNTVPEVGLGLHSWSCKHWETAKTSGIRANPADLRHDPNPKVLTLSTPSSFPIRPAIRGCSSRTVRPHGRNLGLNSSKAPWSEFVPFLDYDAETRRVIGHGCIAELALGVRLGSAICRTQRVRPGSTGCPCRRRSQSCRSRTRPETFWNPSGF